MGVNLSLRSQIPTPALFRVNFSFWSHVNEPTPLLMGVKVSLWSHSTKFRTYWSQYQFIVTAPTPTYLWELILVYSHCNNSQVIMGVNISL